MAPAEDILPLLQRHSTFGTWRFDALSGEVWWSENVYKIHGLESKPGAVDIERGVKAYHPEDARTVNFLIEQALDNKKGFEFVLRLTRADGKMRYVESVGMIKEDSKGEVRFIYGTLRDVTENISEKEISIARGLLVKSIVENSPAPLVIVNREMEYLQISPAWAEFHKIPNPAKYIGKSHYLMMKNVPQAWKDEHQRALKGEIIHRTTTLKIGPDEPPESFGSVVFPWRIDAERVGGLIIMVTPRAKTDQENADQAAKFAGLFGNGSPAVRSAL